MLLTCKIFPGRPVMGAWVSYALGTENQNLPAYVVLRDPQGYTIGGSSALGERISACALSGCGVQYERRARVSSESRTAAAARRAAGASRSAGETKRTASARPSRRNRTGRAHSEFRTGGSHASGRHGCARYEQRDRSHEEVIWSRQSDHGELWIALSDGTPAGGGGCAFRGSDNESRASLGTTTTRSRAACRRLPGPQTKGRRHW